MSWDLIADIGGTNTRLAQVVDGEITTSKTYTTKGDASLLDMITDFVSKENDKPKGVVIAAAGPVKDDYFILSNAKKDLNRKDVEALCATDKVRFINDFAAAAWSLATVDGSASKCLQGPTEIPLGHRLIIGPGTGLGVGYLAYQNKQFLAVPGEGGHVGIAPMNRLDVDVFDAFQSVWPETQHGSETFVFEAEAMLSGTGLPYLYQAVCKVHGQEANLNSAKDILAAAQQGQDASAEVSLDIFRRHLGKVAGDLAFSCHTKGGAFLTGGVLLKNPWILEKTFLDSFNAGGRFTDTRKEIPIYLYHNENFGLDGAANALKFNPF